MDLVLMKVEGDGTPHHPKTDDSCAPLHNSPSLLTGFSFAPPDESDLLRAIVNDPDAALRVLPTFNPQALTNDAARRLFGACRAVWSDGTPLSSDALATYCEAQADASDQGDEYQLWIECQDAALCELATAPAGMKDAAKEAEVIAKRLSKVPRFSFLSLGEVLQRPDPTFLIDRLLTMGGTSLLTAKHASFKSFFALDMALCVATGRTFHDLATERGAVVYVAAEGAAGLKKRAAAWLHHHGEATPPDFAILDTPLQVANDAERGAFAAAIQARFVFPALIVLDTLARCAVGLDENNTGDMGAFADAIGELARSTGAHVLVVHHNNKNGDYRGSSALPAAVDTHLVIERHTETDAVTLTTEKQKDAEELAPLSFEKVPISLPNTGGLGHSLVFARVATAATSQWQLSQSEQKALDELSGAFGDTGATAAKWLEACEGAGIKRRAFFYAKTKLIKVGAVACPDEQKRGGCLYPFT